MHPTMMRLRRSQPTLFQPLASRPSFPTLPPQIQAHTIQLVGLELRILAVIRGLDSVMQLGFASMAARRCAQANPDSSQGQLKRHSEGVNESSQLTMIRIAN
jgi:hypothetical protein